MPFLRPRRAQRSHRSPWSLMSASDRTAIATYDVHIYLGFRMYELLVNTSYPSLDPFPPLFTDGFYQQVVVLMINFTFSALTLGFASAGTYVPRTRAVLASIWHEALPMLVYSQVLIWGQSCMSLLTVGLLRLGNPDVSPFLGALVTMGLETGRDVMSFSSTEIAGDWAEEV